MSAALVPREPEFAVPPEWHLYELTHLYNGNGLYLLNDLGDNYVQAATGSARCVYTVWSRLMAVYELQAGPVPIPSHIAGLLSVLREELALGVKALDRGFVVPGPAAAVQ